MANQANFYKLSKGKTEVVYSENPFFGGATLSYKDGTISVSSRTFRSEKTSIGLMVTMTIEVVHDAYTKDVSLLVPHVHLGEDNEAKVKSVLIYTVQETSFAGHDFVDGQVTHYETKTVKGTASHVV